MIRKSAFNKKIQEEQMGFTSDYARRKREGKERRKEERRVLLMALRRVKAIQSRLFLGKEL